MHPLIGHSVSSPLLEDCLSLKNAYTLNGVLLVLSALDRWDLKKISNMN